MNELPAALRISTQVTASAVLAFLLLPILAVVPASLNRTSIIYLPPHDLSLRWYGAFLLDPAWRSALLVSVEVAVVATIVSVTLGTTAALGLRTLPSQWRPHLTGIVLAPMVVPTIVSAVAIYRSALDVHLADSFLGLSLSHALLGLPLVYINVVIALRTVDEVWLRAAYGLGADQWTAFRTIILPNIMPGMLGGAVFAFMTSFDEVVLAIFMAGEQTKTLPIRLWESIRLDFSPMLAVVSTFVLLVAMALLVLAAFFWRRPEREDFA